ncbi:MULTISPECIES: PilN domain-containing protein [Halomonas]|uniref:Pilus assembly protein PilN n=1 Tax=Halomonas halophila TaxID=29573 RepID=A0ABQ0U2H3_9GAMM|nr:MULTISPECIES: PilN domain-containing protein [Halomonas]MDR5890056.1 PilN domain-containing protein [Halomonas salina]RAH39256.1 fimbrial assembly protein [Halomonas sp. SL1]WJY06840.1 PilN domain-containing protein [Halomonas halophila]GEK72736.1 pilus assembly protein PilN [Halomonas halophila]
MTIEINLLPWREAQRQRRSKRFHLALALAALIGLGGGYAVTWYHEQQLMAQQQRHALIRQRTAELDHDIRTVSEYESRLETLDRRIEVLQELQAERPQTVHVFNALAASLEEGVYYVDLQRQGDRLHLTGLAPDNRRVSDQLRALEASPVLDVPVLSEVEAEGGERRFDLSVGQHMPGAANDTARQEVTP